MSKILALLLLLSVSSFAQDCSEVLIKKQYDDGTVMWRSPVTADIYFIKKIKTDGSFTFSVQVNQFSGTNREGAEYKGMVLKTATATITRPDAPVTVTSENSQPPFWKYGAGILLTEDEMLLLKTSPLTYVEVAGVSERTQLRQDQQELYHQYFLCVLGAGVDLSRFKTAY